MNRNSHGKIRINGVYFSFEAFLTYFMGFVQGDGSISIRLDIRNADSFTLKWDLGMSQKKTSMLLPQLVIGLKTMGIQASLCTNKNVLNIGSIKSLSRLFELLDKYCNIVPLSGFKARNYIILQHLVKHSKSLSKEVIVGLLFSLHKEYKNGPDVVPAQRQTRQIICSRLNINEVDTVNQCDKLLTFIDEQYHKHGVVIKERSLENKSIFHPYYIVGLIDADGFINVDKPRYFTPGKIYLVPFVRFITTYTSILSMSVTKSIVGLNLSTRGKDNQKKTQGWKWSKQADVDCWLNLFDDYPTPHIMKRKTIKLIQWAIYLRDNKLVNTFSKIEPYIKESYNISDLNGTTAARSLSLVQTLEKIRNHVDYD